ncbi:uncharacterized protein LOC125532587 [Triticum urartu]|uniref:uncharacterized protein LOC125532587 n=1 Tax=Triticum urartu TaxID=4572 RepID=UPI0020441D95|nr:uncharacterized protein LOC125532587 [Triticum urartu]
MSQAGQAGPAAPVAKADLEADIAALLGRKQRLRETFDRLVACAPLHARLPFTWEDIDAHVSSLHASFSLRFRQMQQQPRPIVPVPVSVSSTHDDEQPHPSTPVYPTATPDGDQPHPGVPVSATHDSESIQEDEEILNKDEENSKDEDASRVQEKKEDQMEKVREGKKVSLATLEEGIGSVVAPRHKLPYVPYFRQEFLPDVVRQEAPMGIDHVLQQQQYMAMAHHQPYLPQTTNEDVINVLVNKPSKKSKTINKHNAKRKPDKPKHNAKPMPEEPIEKKAVYDYF